MEKSSMKYFIIILYFLLFVNSGEAMETKAKQAILIDYNTSEIFLEKNADEKAFPSSMTKIMTSYIVFDMLDSGELKLSDRFKVSEKASKQEGASMFLRSGAEVLLDELLYGIIVQSGNDAAFTLAEIVLGGKEEFFKRMNNKAKKLGLKNTNFLNSIGWSEEGHYMSVRDTALLSSYLIKNHSKYYKKYFSQKSYKYNDIEQRNRNWLLDEFWGTDGLKTGHTDAGGYALAASAVRYGKRLIAVVNGLTSERERIDEAKKLLKYGFDKFKRVKLFSKNDRVSEVRVWMGNKEKINLIVKNNIHFTVKKDLAKRVGFEIQCEEYIKAPIGKKEVVGKLAVKIPNKGVKYYNLYSDTDVEELGWFGKLWFLVKYWSGFLIQYIKNI